MKNELIGLFIILIVIGASFLGGVIIAAKYIVKNEIQYEKQQQQIVQNEIGQLSHVPTTSHGVTSKILNWQAQEIRETRLEVIALKESLERIERKLNDKE